MRGAHSFSRLSAATASSAAPRRARFARSCSRSASSASTSRCRAPTWSQRLNNATVRKISEGWGR